MDGAKKRVLLGMASGFLLGLLCNVLLMVMLVFVWVHHMFLFGVPRAWVLTTWLAFFALIVSFAMWLAVRALRQA
jgi:drug/metabolite transporter (DMT)-like permease